MTDPITTGLTGRLAVVTGATRGIGLAIADALAAAGADVVAISASVGPGSEVEQRVRVHGRSFEGIRVDFGDPDRVDAVGQELAARDRWPDIVVNNAGTTERGPAETVTRDQWDRVLAVNLTSQFLLTQQLARPMLAAGSGSIIFVASVLSFQGGINVSGYAASKSGIAGLTRALANEWAGRGVNVNAIAPGYVATDLNTALLDDPDRSAAILARIPAGRWGRPEDIAGAAVFLASPAAAYVHGSVLAVDGGWLAG